MINQYCRLISRFNVFQRASYYRMQKLVSKQTKILIICLEYFMQFYLKSSLPRLCSISEGSAKQGQCGISFREHNIRTQALADSCSTVVAETLSAVCCQHQKTTCRVESDVVPTADNLTEIYFKVQQENPERRNYFETQAQISR